jgi:hypothetical protein
MPSQIATSLVTTEAGNPKHIVARGTARGQPKKRVASHAANNNFSFLGEIRPLQLCKERSLSLRLWHGQVMMKISTVGYHRRALFAGRKPTLSRFALLPGTYGYDRSLQEFLITKTNREYLFVKSIYVSMAFCLPRPSIMAECCFINLDWWEGKGSHTFHANLTQQSWGERRHYQA